MKRIIKLLCPPILLFGISSIRKRRRNTTNSSSASNGLQQDLGIYWTEDMANQLESWGKDHTWIEIECLLASCSGKVLDIACGTGVNIVSLSKFDFLEVYGFDISNLLLDKAKEKGIDSKYLKQFDATRTEYADNEFEYSYSIGSLEHFTEDGIDKFLAECNRYTKKTAFHMIPVSENDENNGWITRGQSYFNNSVEWWNKKFSKHFTRVYVLRSGWSDSGVSVGKWFICFK